MRLVKIISVVLVVVFSIQWFENSKSFEISKNIELFANLYKEVNTYYVEEVDPSTLMNIGVKAMMESLDPYTNYITETQIESYRFKRETSFDGISGAKIKKIGDEYKIIEIIEGSMAQKGGLKVGDQIKRINGQPVLDKSPEEVSTLISSTIGSPVDLEVEKSGKTINVNIARNDLDEAMKNVPYSGEVDSDIGYISLTTFTRNAGKNVGQALIDLKEEHDLKGVILDLRNNGGGLLMEAINVTNVFIEQGQAIVSTKGKVKEWDKSYSTNKQPVDLDIPLVILVNKNTASASEIVSGVVQDFDRGVILGQRSYGKGLVQNTRELGYNSRVKITTHKYYIPSGRCIQSVAYKDGEPIDIPDDQRSTFTTRAKRPVLDGGGITPDIKIALPEKSDLLKGLLAKHIIFEFVNGYVADLEEIADPGIYRFKDYEQFISFANDMNFEYTTEEQDAMVKLLAQMKENKGLYKEIEPELISLDEKIDQFTSGDFEKYKDEIITVLEEEIISRFYFKKGKVKHKLEKDLEIISAVELINDLEKYNSILAGQQ
jgi:carboxyl-terminal processing protease